MATVMRWLADMFMAGGSPAAKERVRQLVKDVGFADAIDMGGNDAVALLEAFALVWIQLAVRQKMGRGTAIRVMRR
jgi:predicted dinucleotide-binding enzyme